MLGWHFDSRLIGEIGKCCVINLERPSVTYDIVWLRPVACAINLLQITGFLFALYLFASDVGFTCLCSFCSEVDSYIWKHILCSLLYFDQRLIKHHLLAILLFSMCDFSSILFGQLNWSCWDFVCVVIRKWHRPFNKFREDIGEFMTLRVSDALHVGLSRL